MGPAAQSNNNLIGAFHALLAVACFSVNDASFKFLSDQYALHQIVVIRAVGALITLFVLLPFLIKEKPMLRTRRLRMHLLRGLCVVFANMSMFLALAALPMADAVAVFFVSPLVITLFSVIFLREWVGPRRWLAIAVGFVGVLVIVKPGTSAFQVATLLPILAAVLYAAMHMLTRRLGGTESALTMACYIQIAFLVSGVIFGLMLGHGGFAGNSHPSLQFLLRAWAPIRSADIPILIALSLSVALGGFFISQAYRLSEAAFVAPIEYVGMPMAILSGVIVFGTWPDHTAWIGIALIIGSGLYMLFRDSGRGKAPQNPTLRR